MSKKKKTLVMIMVALVLIAFAIMMFTMRTWNKDLSTEIANPDEQRTSPYQELDLPETQCDYSDDIEAKAAAIEKREIAICGCIKEDQEKQNCQGVVMDLKFYYQAIGQYDLALCENIYDESRKAACQSVVSSGLEYLKQNDPALLARISINNHNNDQAAQLFEQLLAENPDNVKYLVSLALTYAEKGLKEQEQGRDQTPWVEKALVTLEKAKQINSIDSEIYRVEGYSYEIKPDINAAIVSYDKAIELDGNNALAYAGRGHAESMNGLLDLALEDFKQASKLDTNNENIFIYSNLCRLESSRDDLLNDAIKNCQIVLDNDYQDPVFKSETSQILAEIYMKSRSYAEARSLLLTAKTLTPNDPNLHVAFSKLDFFEDDYAGAQAQAEKAIELSPTKTASFLALANALYMQEKFDQAIEQAEKGIRLVQNDVSLLEPSKSAMTRDLYYTIAHSYRHMGDNANQEKYMQMAEAIFDE